MSDTEERSKVEVDESVKKAAKDLDERLKMATKGEIPKEHKFWDTQPVPKMDENTVTVKPKAFEGDEKDVRQEPYKIPDAFRWVECDVNDPAELKEIYTLLSENYVEDDDAMFRFDYSPEFLNWALLPPGWLKEWHVGIRAQQSNKLVAFITGIPADVRVRDETRKMVEINFLCVHKKLRSKRLAPVLIKEITRRVNLKGIFQAVYTAGTVLPKPVSSCRYWHRSLNPKKLIEIGFSGKNPKLNMSSTIRLYSLPEEPAHKLVPMQERHVKSAYQLLDKYLKQFKLHTEFTEKEFRHWFFTRDNVVYSFVIEDPKDKTQVTDFTSFYSLPSSILGNPNYDTLNVAYSFYHVNTSVTMEALMKDCLIMANNLKYDVFNALDLMENESVFKNLKFGVGDGHLQYYLFNWVCPPMQANEVGLVLL
eukprot:GFYU01010741.1.p1 GENE.GFYU01010741.1~~GFYU01010741.1.p1  ORF type:complete len:422 (+),score=144.14 GFYU01010741.1:122-1387(+)